jgi:hypothetical protein
MGYTILSIRRNNSIRKYILFYADYLQEAWLSEVKDNETTKIVRQFKCKDTDDFEELSANLARMGEIVNLASNETIEQHLAVLDMKLEKPRSSKLVESVVALRDKLVNTISSFRGSGTYTPA